jgi:hypothetical protein
VVLRASREHERLGGFSGRRDPFGRVGDVVQPSARVVVLDRAARCTRVGRAGDGKRGVLGLRAVAVLQVDRDGQVRRAVDEGRVGDHLVQRDVTVGAPEREREPGAGGRERLEAEPRQHLRRAGVPGIRDDERLARV